MCAIPLTGSVPFSHLFYSSVLISFHPYIQCSPLPPSTSHLFFSFTPLFTHLCFSALFLFHLPSLSFPLEFLRCGRGNKQNSESKMQEKAELKDLCTHRYRVLSSGNIQEGPVLTGLNMHQSPAVHGPDAVCPSALVAHPVMTPVRTETQSWILITTFGLASVLLPKIWMRIKVILLTEVSPSEVKFS